MTAQQLDRAEAFRKAYGRMHGNPMDQTWNVWCAAWQAALDSLTDQPAATPQDGRQAAIDKTLKVIEGIQERREARAQRYGLGNAPQAAEPAQPVVETVALRERSNEDILQMAPIAGNFTEDEIDAFCAGFRRCAKLLATPPLPEDRAALTDANAKLLALADQVDYEELWRRSVLERFEMTPEQVTRLDAGVALRRYADLLGDDKMWRLFPPRPGVSFRASTLDKAVEMARRDEERRAHGIVSTTSPKDGQ